MINIIKEIINYIPVETYDKLLNTKIASIVSVEDDTNDHFSDLSDEKDIPTITMKVEENKVNEFKIEKTTDPIDILEHILDTFDRHFKHGMNYNHEALKMDKNKMINDSSYLNSKLYFASNLIYSNSRNGAGDTVMLPKKLYHKIDIRNTMLKKKVINPINDKIYVISKPKDIHNCKYHLLTIPKIPSNRELKLNKLMGKETNEIHYGIIPVRGHAESVVIFNLE